MIYEPIPKMQVRESYFHAIGWRHCSEAGEELGVIFEKRKITQYLPRNSLPSGIMITYSIGRNIAKGLSLIHADTCKLFKMLFPCSSNRHNGFLLNNEDSLNSFKTKNLFNRFFHF